MMMAKNQTVEASESTMDDLILLVQSEEEKPQNSEAGNLVSQLSLEEGDRIVQADDEITPWSQDSAEAENIRIPVKVIRKTVIRQDPSHSDFVRKTWTAFLTFHLFVIPALIGLILGLILNNEYFGIEDSYMDIKQHIMMGFLGASVMVGLPFHMMALADLEDTVQDVMSAQVNPDQPEDEIVYYDTMDLTELNQEATY